MKSGNSDTILVEVGINYEICCLFNHSQARKKSLRNKEWMLKVHINLYSLSQRW